MNCYAIFDADGLNPSFYEIGVNSDSPPNGSVSITPEERDAWVAHPSAFRWDGTKIVSWSPPEISHHATECTPAQGQMALYQAGHYDAYVQAVTNSTDVPLKIYAQSALKWEISNPHIQTMKVALGLSDSDVQSLFDLAVTL
jgi:hypothetical protein